jgi:hypothetical protein
MIKFPVLVALLITLGCSPPGRPAGKRASLDSVAEAYVRLALALGERDPDALEGFRGPAEWQAEAHARRATLVDIARDANTLVADVLALREVTPGEERRRAFLAAQVRAIAARAEIVGGKLLPVADEARILFGLSLPERPPFKASVYSEESYVATPSERQRIAFDQLLPGHGDVSARVAADERRFVIPSDRFDRVFRRAIEECRAATRAHIQLPDGERVEVEYVRDLPWSAFTRYEGNGTSRIRVNAGLGLPVDSALDLACHEAYPGHHTIDVLIDERLKRMARPPVELSVRLLFSPLTALHEGAASAAPRLLFSLSERRALERDVLFPLAGLDPAGAYEHAHVSVSLDDFHDVQADVTWRYLNGELDFARASAAFERQALMASPDATLKFLNQFRTYGLTYTLGRDAFMTRLNAAAPPSPDTARRWEEYARLATDLW